MKIEARRTMTETLYQRLQRATSEEDVKDIYIKALGLKNV
jgi:hypothetical protein